MTLEQQILCELFEAQWAMFRIVHELADSQDARVLDAKEHLQEASNRLEVLRQREEVRIELENYPEP